MGGLGILVFTAVGGFLGAIGGLTYGLITGYTYNFEMAERIDSLEIFKPVGNPDQNKIINKE